MAKPIIKTELLSSKLIPKYGGTVKIKVIYEDYKSINLPTISFNGVKQNADYMSYESVATNDTYFYVFDFPKNEEADRVISILFLAIGEANEISTSNVDINQQGEKEGEEEEEEEINFGDDTLTLSSNGGEYSYEESEGEFPLQIKVKTAIDEEIGSLGVVINENVNWVRLDITGTTNINRHYYKETIFNYTVALGENVYNESRLAVVKLDYYNTNNFLVDSKEYVIVQDSASQLNLPSNKIEYYSCWEDIIFTLENEDVFNYGITMSTFVENARSEETTIFNGRAYKYPNADNIEIKLNKIFENYLTNSLNNVISKLDLNTTIDYNNRNYESCKRFRIYNRDTNEVLKEYRVLYDWSYVYRWRGGDEVLSRSIEDKKAYGQLNFNTTISKIGIVTNHISNIDKNSCGEYCVYYLNSYGGWDSLLINNKVNKTKNINSYTTEKYIRNLNVDFEQYRYISEIQDSYEITTNLLTDEQATNIVDNLFTSNEVYLHNLTTDIINAVLVTNNKVNYKKYSDNLELPYFTINIKESQIQLKR